MKMTNGILIVNKEPNYTSRDVVNIVSKKLQTKKVGHTGTLDPLASGVLVICVERYTKLVDLLTCLNKEYIAEIKLGIATDTLDITGNILESKSFDITQETIKETLESFIGEYQMEVPIYSAIKVGGKKLYEYARNNELVELPVKKVKIYEINFLSYHNDIIKFKVKVEKGTYIRSLIRDICQKLNTVGTMNSLVRTKQGEFSLSDAINIDDIKNNNFKLLKAQDILKFKQYHLNDTEFQKVQNGNEIYLPLEEEYILLLYNLEEIAIYKNSGPTYKCYIMLKI